jgi:hypothetical protein
MTTLTKTYHTEDCRRVFKRYDLSCPRCSELANGSEARKGWGPSNDQRRCVEIDSHFKSEKHLSGGCGIVCTFGEW